MRNKVPVLVDKEFKDLLKIEAKTKGMSISSYTEKIVKEEGGIEDLAKGWGKKYKKNTMRGFDFP